MLKPFDRPAKLLSRAQRPTTRLLIADLVRELEVIAGVSLQAADFASTVGALATEAAAKITSEPHLLYGKRVEALFPFIVAELGRAELISEEGAGQHWSSEPITPPDWRIVLPEVGTILVEVKNKHHATFDFENRFTFDRRAHERLQTYARLSTAPLYYAIYWTAATRWTLVRADRLALTNDDARITYGDAQQLDEMSLVGDFLFSLPKPVTYDFFMVNRERGIRVPRAGGKPLGPAGAALLEEIIVSSGTAVDEEEIVVDGKTGTRFTLRTRVHGEAELVCEPISAIITHGAFEMNEARTRIPRRLHAPIEKRNLLAMIDAAQAEGLQLERYIFGARQGGR